MPPIFRTLRTERLRLSVQISYDTEQLGKLDFLKILTFNITLRHYFCIKHPFAAPIWKTLHKLKYRHYLVKLLLVAACLSNLFGAQFRGKLDRNKL